MKKLFFLTLVAGLFLPAFSPASANPQPIYYNGQRFLDDSIWRQSRFFYHVQQPEDNREYRYAARNKNAALTKKKFIRYEPSQNNQRDRNINYVKRRLQGSFDRFILKPNSWQEKWDILVPKTRKPDNLWEYRKEVAQQERDWSYLKAARALAQRRAEANRASVEEDGE